MKRIVINNMKANGILHMLVSIHNVKPIQYNNIFMQKYKKIRDMAFHYHGLCHDLHTALSFKTGATFQECCYFIADFRAHFSHAT